MFKMLNGNNWYRQIHIQLHGKENMSVYKPDKTKIKLYKVYCYSSRNQRKIELCIYFKREHIQIFKK